MERLGIYVDVENLPGVAKEAIKATFNSWPEELPRPGLLHLYVKADNVGVWKLWATDSYPSIDIEVTGVQHYALDGSKNSADISLSLDAITDLLKGRISHVAILSDDSDFAILFAKIALETPKRGNEKLPFVWFQTDRPHTSSSMINEFLPAHYLRTVICAKHKIITPKTKSPAKEKPAVPKSKQVTKKKTTTTNSKRADKQKTTATKEGLSGQTADEPGTNVSVAETIIRFIPEGLFTHAECMKLIKQHFPDHSFVKLNSVKFGSHFVETLWPILETYGVRVPNPNRRPKRYEMTAEAKRKVGVSLA